MIRFSLYFLIGSFLLAMVSCGKKIGADKLIPVENFFLKPEKSNFKLSPDGRYIAYLGLDDHCKNIFILNLEDKHKSKQLTYQSDMNVQYFFWASDSMLVFSNAHSSTDSLRIYAIGVNSEEKKQIIPTKKARLRWLMPQRMHDDHLLMTINDRDSSVFDLYKVFIDGRAPQLVTQNPGNISKWIASPDGKVRLAMTSDSVQESLLYRPSEQDPFKQVSFTDYQTILEPIGFVKNSTTNIYALSNKDRDKLALVEYNCNTGKEERLIYSNNEVDLESSGYSHYLQELIYSSYTIDRSEKFFFNDVFKKQFDQLAAQFKGQSIDILDTDNALQHWIVRIATDVYPGGVYHYDVKKNKAVLLSETNPKLVDATLSPKQAINFQSRDGLTLNGYLTYPASGVKDDLPVVVLVHDGPYRRETASYDPEVQFLANRGYLVFQLNYRGSSGYGKKFWAAGFKEWGGKIQTDIIDGVTWLIHQGIVDKNRVAIMGTGFGGYSALHGATYNSSFYKCAISMSGYTNLFTYLKEIPPYQQQYTKLFYQIIGNPVRESDLFKAISPVFHADKVKIPVFIAQGGKDAYSSSMDASQFVQRLKNNNIPVRYLYKEDEGRRFRNEENIVNYYQEVETFLKQYLK